MNFLASTVGKIVAALVLVVIVLGGLQFCSWQRARQQAAQSKVDRGQAGAARESAAEAVNTISDVAANQSASEDLTRSNEREIRNAEGASDRVNPDVGAAGVRAICRRAASRNDPKCRMLQPPAR